MKKVIVCICFSFSLLCYSSVIIDSVNEDKVNEYANIYADLLIEEFDQYLEKKQPERIMNSFLYAKIQAARILMEETGDVSSYVNGGLVKIQKPNIYNEVVELIDSRARKIYAQMGYQKFDSPIKSDFNLVIYPSFTGEGNLTGNTYPKGVWSLSFDDGPGDLSTKAVVDNLYLHGYKASFFMLMRQVKRFSKSLDYILDHEMEIALHSYTHKDLNKASEDLMHFEIDQALLELKSAVRRNITLFRLPYGSGLRNQLLRKKIAKSSLVHVFWNVDTLDWKDRDPQSIMKRTIAQMSQTPNKSGIILFHDIHTQTVIASELIMKYLKETNQFVCTVGQMVKYFNKEEQDCLK